MRLLDLEIHNVRGIRHLELHPAGKNLVILGPNGSGKSAVVDAIDFLLTGSISRLSGEGTAGINLKSHGGHIDAQPKEVWVKAHIQANGQTFEISRCLAKEKELVCPEQYRPAMERVVALARLGHHVLTRREILRFVTAKSSDRAQEIQALLDIEETNQVRLAIKAATSTLEALLKSKKREVDQAQEAVRGVLGLAKYDEQGALEVINAWRDMLGGAPLEQSSMEDPKQGLHAAGLAAQPIAVNLSGLKRHLATIGSLLSPDAIQRRLTLYDQMQAAYHRVGAKPRLVQDLKALELIQIGQSLLDSSGKCPLCLAEHPPGYLEDLLKERLRYAGEAGEIQAELQGAGNCLSQDFEIVYQVLDDLFRAAERAGLSSETERLRGWMGDNRSFVAQALKDREIYRFSLFRERYASLDLPGDFPHQLESIFAALECRFPAVTPEQDAWDQLTKLEVHLQKLAQAQAELQRLYHQRATAEKLKLAYEAARDGVLANLYHTVCQRFAELYTMLHEEDESDFCAQLAPAGAGVDFRVGFHGHGNHPPHALHSEGHQDSMGVCLFLALAERLTQGTLDLIVLDDVVMSVDIGHRRQLGKMLVEKLPHRQLILTTHDRMWASQLRNVGMVSSKGMIEFQGWDFATGPLSSDPASLWERIDKALGKGEVNLAAAELRRGLEEFAYHACDALQAKVRFAMDGRWELGDLLPAAIGQYKYLLGKAKAAANSWNIPRQVEALAAIEQHSKAILEQKDREYAQINPNVHYTPWAGLTPAEFRQVVAAHKALVDLFYCPSCGSLAHLVLDGPTPVNLRCLCGEFNWNLVEKAKKGN